MPRILWCLLLVGSVAAQSRHTNNWAVLVDSSRFWFNYRHIANTLSFYRTVQRLGIPDSQIILMLADDVACNPRNSHPGAVYNNQNHKLNLYGEAAEVDYRGYEVTAENFIRLLTGRHSPDTPRSKRLLTDESSNIFIFMTGHGGIEFLKFQDNEEISSRDIGDAFATMHEKRRYNEILFMIDTCQGASMAARFYSPNVLAVASALVGENSYSHHVDLELGVSVIDRFTYYALDFLEGVTPQSTLTLAHLFSSFDPVKINSNPGFRVDLFQRPLDQVLITDFFGAVQHVQLSGGGRNVSFIHEESVGRSSESDAEPHAPEAKHDMGLDASREKHGAGVRVEFVVSTFLLFCVVCVLTLVDRRPQ